MAMSVMYSCPRVEVRMCVHMCASVSAMTVVFGCAEVIVMTSRFATTPFVRRLTGWTSGKVCDAIRQPNVEPGNRNQSSRKCLHIWLL